MSKMNHIHRMIAEYIQLLDRIDRIETALQWGFSDDDRADLIDQQTCMVAYSMQLKRRLYKAGFNIDNLIEHVKNLKGGKHCV